MMELTTLQKFLTSLAPLSRMQYQLWDVQGKMLFPAPAVSPHDPRISKALQKMAGLVAEQKRFRYGKISDQYFLCGFPLSNGQGMLGSLVAFDPEPSSEAPGSPDATREKARTMEKFLGNLATLVQANWMAEEEIQELAEELEQSFEELYLYGKIASQIKTLKLTNHMLVGLITSLLNNLRADIAFAILPERQEFNTFVSKPDIEKRLNNALKFQQKLLDYIPDDAPSLAEKYFIVNDSKENASYQRLHPDPYRFLGVMVAHEDNFYGWLGLVSFNMKEIFRQGELRMMVSLAEQLSVVITNTGLYQDLEQFIINMVKSLVFAIEAKDVYTRGHSERVSRLSMRLAKHLGLKGKAYDELRWASILHDIGKIGIPGEILNKPSRLTDEEYDIVKEHPSKGFEILSPVSQLGGSLKGILHHHERVDGKGYPSGLKGEKIPFNSRIIAVADTYDAISSSRAYRPSKSSDEAMAIVKEVSGSQLDPQVVAALVEIAETEGLQ
jgi:HD-GYP domain-containing protein (c-di-GMP phosphodiesterase class II)